MKATVRYRTVMDIAAALRRIRILILFFIVGLVISGLTAIPLMFELSVLDSLFGEETAIGDLWPALAGWISLVHHALEDLHSQYPFLAYGYDWLAFGHFVIAIIFIGPYRDPIRNEWVISAGLIACALVVPYAIILGQFREIPLFWRLIDSLFGIIGFAVLWIVRSQLQLIKSAEMADS